MSLIFSREITNGSLLSYNLTIACKHFGTLQLRFVTGVTLCERQVIFPVFFFCYK